jgi:hypothetical protein
MAAVD